MDLPHRLLPFLLCSLPLPAILAQAPDLVVAAIDRDRLAGDWQRLQVQGDVVITVRNQGSAASGACQLTLFEDGNGSGVLEASDRVLGIVAVPAVPVGALARVTVAVDAPVRFRDDRLFAMVDSGHQVAESNESNNVRHTGGDCTLAPVQEWAWTGSAMAPASLNVPCTPLVCDLDGDGFPEVVLQTTSSTAGSNQIAGELRAVDGRTGADRWAVTSPQVVASFTPAVGDIDGDGRPEIVTAAVPGTVSRLLCFEHDGTFKWQSDPVENVGYGGASLADLDGDGRPEIVVGRQVLDRNGVLLWTGTGGSTGSLAKLSLVADVDLDGSPEVVAGNTVYSAAGAVRWTGGSDYFVAVADFDGDPQAEIVQVGNGRPTLRNHDLTLVWNPPANAAANGRGGAPTIADFDGDGRPEIGIAGSTVYRVFDTDGTLLWSQTIRDNTSHMTAGTAFDFDGDGALDVVYRDETTLWVFRGIDGAVLWSLPMSSCTWIENVVVADVDGDGRAEIVVGANNNCGFGPQRGLRVYGDSRGAWPATRPVWNQFNYSITNVLDDGRIPAAALPNWRTPAAGPHNNFRVNPAQSAPARQFPDLTVSALVAPCQGPRTIGARIGNGGAATAAAGVAVAFWLGDPLQGGALLGATTTAAPLPPGSFVDVGIAWAGALNGTLHVVVDPLDQVAECHEGNNAHSAAPCATNALWQNYGTGWPGSLGVPAFSLDRLPQLGTSPNLLVGNSAGVPTFGAFVLGGGAVALPSGYGGTILADPLVTSAFFLPPGQSAFGVAVPCLPAACGAGYFLQVVQLDAGASHGVAFSRGLQVVFGR